MVLSLLGLSVMDALRAARGRTVAANIGSVNARSRFM